jgi:hypothetical protein
MSDCANLEKYAFFKQYQNDDDKKYALMGFVRSYCRGDKQDMCVRKKVSKTLGGPDKVPLNMMPTGLPLFGTTKKDWPEEVKALL